MAALGRDSTIRLIFVDEYSFLSQAHLSAMAKRCQQCSNDNANEFGAFHIALVGDPRQHDPPGATPLVKGAAAEERLRNAVVTGEVPPTASGPGALDVNHDPTETANAGMFCACHVQTSHQPTHRTVWTVTSDEATHSKTTVPDAICFSTGTPLDAAADGAPGVDGQPASTGPESRRRLQDAHGRRVFR